MLQTLNRAVEQRLRNIEQARRAVLIEGCEQSEYSSQAWISRSWRRCLANGHQPHQTVVFDMISAEAARRTHESNRTLVAAARPALKKLGHAIADTRYFAILTNACGVVVDVNGPIDRHDPRATAIARVGIDLSERNVGTTAIGAALAELQPVSLHRGEHFFAGNGAYSCAGAPLFGPDGACVGMLDVTGIDADERPELKHLVVQSARAIENALTVELAHSLLVRLNWPGHSLGDDTDGLVCLDEDGWVKGANQAARQMVSSLNDGSAGSAAPIHSSELFAMPYEMLFDAAGRDSYGQPAPLDVPLWSGLRLHAMSQNFGQQMPTASSGWGALGTSLGSGLSGSLGHADHHSLRDVETALIRQAVTQAKGNVMQAARELGISRATVYRKLGNKRPL